MDHLLPQMNCHHPWRRWFSLFVAIFAVVPTYAKNPLEVSLISERNAIVPGSVLWVGFWLKHPPGFHSYSQHPGGIGLATSVQWDLPPGFSAGEIHWPSPQRVMMGEHRAQGYRGEVLLMVPLFPPLHGKSTRITLRAKLDWLCCGQACHHAHQVPFALTLPVREEAAIEPQFAALFAQARRSWPRAQPRWQMSFRQQKRTVILTIRPHSAADRWALLGSMPWFATDDGVIDSTKAQRYVLQPDHAFEMHLPMHELAPPTIDELRGVLVTPRQGIFVRALRRPLSP